MNWERAEGNQEWPGCFGCAHRRSGRRFYCIAYPDGIPFPIASGEINHLVQRPGQVGETIFEPLDLQHWLKTRERRVLAEARESAATI